MSSDVSSGDEPVSGGVPRLSLRELIVRRLLRGGVGDSS